MKYEKRIASMEEAVKAQEEKNENLQDEVERLRFIGNAEKARAKKLEEDIEGYKQIFSLYNAIIAGMIGESTEKHPYRIKKNAISEHIKYGRKIVAETESDSEYYSLYLK